MYWSEGSGENRRTYSNKIDTYQWGEKIFGFYHSIAIGHYAFPFKVLLPESFSGTVSES